ncbi:hypothetical protein RB2654_15045 [Rhodobacterales bacterium HTCC2654]|uniref:Uncharacterized protein n=1 Tax=Maritimibacter alkaliphilus HTCC2654 TaxID=314271 RepID=A3VH58_9RHOB|nr:hypothetical protein RB2654_15045 [Rhodobacterales bacterium HTCC2654] [Maritimibacter alkaliphilus HTCC2654]
MSVPALSRPAGTSRNAQSAANARQSG